MININILYIYYVFVLIYVKIGIYIVENYQSSFDRITYVPTFGQLIAKFGKSMENVKIENYSENVNDSAVSGHDSYGTRGRTAFGSPEFGVIDKREESYFSNVEDDADRVCVWKRFL